MACWACAQIINSCTLQLKKIAKLYAVDQAEELRICWKSEDALNITIDGHDVELQWINVRKDKVTKEWNKYCFVVRRNSGGYIKVEYYFSQLLIGN